MKIMQMKDVKPGQVFRPVDDVGGGRDVLHVMLVPHDNLVLKKGDRTYAALGGSRHKGELWRSAKDDDRHVHSVENLGPQHVGDRKLLLR